MDKRISTLRQDIDAQQPSLRCDGPLLAFPHFWQVPAATEKAAYEAMCEAGGPGGRFEYVALPWATLIDGLNRGAATVKPILEALAQIQSEHPRQLERRVTVAQHIYAMQFPELLTAIGVTDVFWSHAVAGQEEVAGIRVHPFPLYPAQAPSYQPASDAARDRRWLANFIGAYKAGLYLSNVRDLIYADAGRWDDVLVIRRDGWHFDRVVYDEQIGGILPSDERIARERAMTQEYLDAIRQSWFTLCPTGSGPNSIRVFECVALGSIPIILTKSLRLAGDPALWQRAAIVEDDDEAGYRRAIERARRTSIEERQAMIRAARELARQVLPEGYRGLVEEVAATARAEGERPTLDPIALAGSGSSAPVFPAVSILQSLSSRRIAFIGFSFTGFGDATSIGALARQRLQAEGQAWDVQEISYGGLSINALAGLIEQASEGVAAGDLVVLEIATSSFAQLGLTAADALPYIRWMVYHLVQVRQVRVMFIDIYRPDLHDDDCVVQAIREVALESRAPVLDFRLEFRRKYPDAAAVTTDGVHPTEEIRREIAGLFVDFLATQPARVHPTLAAPKTVYRYVDAKPFAQGCQVFPYLGRGKRIEAHVLPEGTSLTFDLGEPTRIVGLYFLYAPETGVVEVRVDGGDPVDLITIDQFSYYRRIGFRQLDKLGRFVEVTSSTKKRTVGLLKPTVLKPERRRDLICGLCVVRAEA